MIHLPEKAAFDYSENAIAVQQTTDPVYVRDVVERRRSTNSISSQHDEQLYIPDDEEDEEVDTDEYEEQHQSKNHHISGRCNNANTPKQRELKQVYDNNDNEDQDQKPEQEQEQEQVSASRSLELVTRKRSPLPDSMGDVEKDFLRSSLAATQEANIKMQNHLMEQSQAFKKEMVQQMDSLTSTVNKKLETLTHQIMITSPQRYVPNSLSPSLNTSQNSSSLESPLATATVSVNQSPAKRQLDQEVDNLRAQIAGTARLIDSQRSHNEDISRSYYSSDQLSTRSPPGRVTTMTQNTDTRLGNLTRASAIATVLTAEGKIKTYPVNVDMGSDAMELPVPRNHKLLNLTVELPNEMGPAQDLAYHVKPIGSSPSVDRRFRLQFDVQRGTSVTTPPKVFELTDPGDVDD
jgi:hypothetical protein